MNDKAAPASQGPEKRQLSGEEEAQWSDVKDKQ